MVKARYLVTGGAGFIGSNIVSALVAAGERVRVLDDLSTGSWENLAALEGSTLVERIEGLGAEAVIPTQKNRAVQRDIDRDLYRERNLVERFWSKAKQYRRVATRYEKKAQNFLAFLHVASIMILLR